MDDIKFDKMIKDWSNLYYTARKFDEEWGGDIQLENDELTPEQFATLTSMNDQHNAWYEEQGLDSHEINRP